MHPRHVSLAAVVALVALAGCLGASAPSEVGPQEVEPETNLVGDDPPQNPWLTEEITVSVVEQPDDRDYQPLIEESLTYWNANMTAVGWQGEFVYAETSDPDVPVKIVEDVAAADTEIDEYEDQELEAVGSAPIYYYPGEANEWEQPIYVQSGLNDTSTIDVAAHEFGHALGLHHEAEDEFPVMAAEMATATEPQPSIYEQANPWDSETIYVYYAEDSELRDQHIEPLEEAREWYDDGADGWLPDDVSVERTHDPDEADITVEMAGEIVGGDHRWQWRGFDHDADGDFDEMYSGEIMMEHQMSDQRVTWAFGHAMGYMFGVEDESELPEPFAEPRIYDPNNW